MGHHLEDLYENFFIRLSRGSGLNGLLSFYEIEKITNGSIKILRPLINNNKKDMKQLQIIKQKKLKEHKNLYKQLKQEMSIIQI